MRKWLCPILSCGLAACDAPPAKPVALHEPTKTVTAETLYKAFAENELAAKRDYENQPIRITGRVAQVADSSVVLLQVGAGVVGLKYLPGYDSTLIELRAGSEISADCEQAMSVLSVVSGQDCRPSPSDPPKTPST